MRLNILLFSLLGMLLISGEEVFSQGSNHASVTGNIYAEIIPMFAASETAAMNFGRFSPGPAGGEIILTPESSISVVGSVFRGIGLFNAASFYVTGDENASFTITLPTVPIVLRHSSSSKTMLIHNWVSSTNQGSGTGILHNGEQTVYVGATLKVGTLQDNPIGIYAGTYTVTFDFN